MAGIVDRLAALQDALLRGVADESGVQAETMPTVAGAMAGQAALDTALVRAADPTVRDGQVAPDALLLLDTEAGERFVAAALVSGHLYGSGDTLARRVEDAEEASVARCRTCPTRRRWWQRGCARSARRQSATGW